jgi:hypothetical protein
LKANLKKRHGGADFSGCHTHFVDVFDIFVFFYAFQLGFKRFEQFSDGYCAKQTVT